MPISRAQAVEQFVADLASMLHPSVPASIETLRADLGCNARTVNRGLKALSDRGVRTTMSDAGVIVTPQSWDACQRIGERA